MALDTLNFSAVPSLYVRVYHIKTLRRESNGCSLIICEGVSCDLLLPER